MTKSDAKAASFYQKYLDRVQDEDVQKALKKSGRQFRKFLGEIPKNKIDFAYAPGKWTIRQVLQHIIDAERVFTYRALSFARKDSAPLPGFDENFWAANSDGGKRKWKDLMEEFTAVRAATEFLFDSFSQDQLLSEGIASNNPVNTLALGYICSGHVVHHMHVIRERYL